MGVAYQDVQFPCGVLNLTRGWKSSKNTITIAAISKSRLTLKKKYDYVIAVNTTNQLGRIVDVVMLMDCIFHNYLEDVKK